MFGEIFTNKWILGGFLLLIIIAGGCYLWYQHQLAFYIQPKAEVDEIRRQWAIERQAKAKSISAKQAADVVSDGSNMPITDKSKTDVNSMTDTSINETKKTITAPTKETAKTEEENESPHGFGPFPKVPPDYPGGYDPNFWTYDWGKNGELMKRVTIKLWEQGKTTHGSTMSNGLVYPTYPDTILVEWRTEKTPFGTKRYASRISWCPEAEEFQRSMKGKTIYEGDFPSRFEIVERKDAGIDPYDFLDLPR